MLGLTKVEGGTVFHEDSYIDESIIFDISMMSLSKEHNIEKI